MTFVGTVDIAQIVLYAFWAFFFGLIIYLQREAMREGYPLESEVTGKPAMFGPFTLPGPKTFKLPHGHGEVTVPDLARDAREITDRKFAMAPTEKWSGSPFEPTGDPLVDGIGPAAWAERPKYPELTLEGHPKIVPMSSTNEWALTEGERDIRGWPVWGCDGQVAGTVKDLWVDRSESLLRYVEVATPAGRNVLCPMTGCVVSVLDKAVKVDSIAAEQFARVPTTAAPDQVTMDEEERISAYYAGGKLYATRERAEPWL